MTVGKSKKGAAFSDWSSVVAYALSLPGAEISELNWEIQRFENADEPFSRGSSKKTSAGCVRRQV
jgi:hypothetical protein